MNNNFTIVFFGSKYTFNEVDYSSLACNIGTRNLNKAYPLSSKTPKGNK